MATKNKKMTKVEKEERKKVNKKGGVDPVVNEVSTDEKPVRKNTYTPRSVLSEAIFDVISTAEHIREKFEKKLPKLNENQFGYIDKKLAATILMDELVEENLRVATDLFDLRLAQKKIMINLSANVKKLNIKNQVKDKINEIGKDLTIKNRALVQDELLGKIIRLPNRNCLSIVTNIVYTTSLAITDEEELSKIENITYEYKTHDIVLKDALYSLPIVSIYNAETQEYVMSLNPVLSIIDVAYKKDEEGNMILEEERINCSGFKYYNVYPIDLKQACLLNIIGI